jgi:hypothetical protein
MYTTEGYNGRGEVEGGLDIVRGEGAVNVNEELGGLKENGG